MVITNTHQAKTHLSQLLARVEKGEEIIIARAGHPIAKLVPFSNPSLERKPGAWKGKILIRDDFDELPSEIIDAFQGTRK